MSGREAQRAAPFTPKDLLVALSMRRQRLTRGLLLADVANMFGWHISHISRVEALIRRPPAAAVAAEKLGVPLEEILSTCPRCDNSPHAGYTCQMCGYGGELPARMLRTPGSEKARVRPGTRAPVAHH